MPASNEIPSQIRLPLSAAVRVVRQGIRIRLGRSLVTLGGVALGIAFVMSTLTSEALRRGMAEEDRFREEANRMFGQLAAESGPLFGRKLGLVLSGAPTAAEERLLERLAREKPREIHAWRSSSPLAGSLAERLALRPANDPLALARGASALLVLGRGEPPGLPWAKMLDVARQPLLASSASAPAFERPGARRVRLSPEADAAERGRRAAEARKASFRTSWIVAISLVVTVMGIANAMLMSVSERFRDIGTMKCLGALSSFVRSTFLIEAGFLGAVGGALGALFGFAFTVLSFFLPYGPSLVAQALGQELGWLAAAVGLSAAGGVVLSMLAALYPAELAARMVPADALRSNV